MKRRHITRFALLILWTSSAVEAAPTLWAVISAEDSTHRTVLVLANNGPDEPHYTCTFTISLSYAGDGQDSDSGQTDVVNGITNGVVSQRNYSRALAGASLANFTCTPE